MSTIEFDGPRLQPGLLRGGYPERGDDEPGWLTRSLRWARGLWFRRGWTRVPAEHRAFVRAVQRHDAELRMLDEPALLTRIEALRLALRTAPATREGIAEAFAIVRELSGRHLGMRHYPVQLAAGWVLFNGALAEMATGEGKTLVAALPAATAALAGVPVHVVTVNDYLVQRDAAQLAPVYEALGLRVGVILEDHQPDDRRDAYLADITYCSNKQVAFDYLKDRLTLGDRTGPLRMAAPLLGGGKAINAEALMRGLCFAIVDEADSVLVDEARTPLIISREGMPNEQTQLYVQALEIAAEMTSVHYRMDRQERTIRLTDTGSEWLQQRSEDLGSLWRARIRREDLITQALSALYLFERDRHYLVQDDAVQIIDEYTGRRMPDRSWERGLHQLIEAKEDVEITGQRETLARISYQRFFRRYLRLAGMSGTVREVAPELWRVYGLRVVPIPTHRPVQRRCVGEYLYADSDRRWLGVLEEIREVHATGRPVLVGTRSVASSERISADLVAAGIAHQMLNARQDASEAEVVSAAGQYGRVLVATNMAGRGTDIKLGDGIAELGGLHVIAAEPNEAGRIDRQLYGRCGRQGDPGSWSAHAAVDDEVFESYAPPWLIATARQLCRQAGPAGVVRGWRARWVVRRVQRAADVRLTWARAQLINLDQRLGDALAFSGRPE